MNQKKNVIIAGILSVTGCMVMIAFPRLSLEAAQKGLRLWAETVVPAMLPFFICAGLMMRLGVPRYLSKYFERPVRKFFCVPGSAAFPFLMSISSGYPIGAKIIAELREKKQITKKEAERMLCFCSTSGPLFMIGAVGVGMMGSMAAGWVIAISHYTGAVLNGMIFRCHGGEQRGIQGAAALPSGQKRDESIVDMLTDAIFSAARTLLLIGGYIIVFMMIVTFLDEFSFFDIFYQESVRSLAKGIFEFTVGCAAASATTLDILLKCVICSALISWGGISTHFQVASILGKTDVDIGFYIRAKLCHALLAALVSFGMGGALLKIAGTSTETGVFQIDRFETSIVGAGALTAQKLTAIGSQAGAGFLETAQIFINKFLFSSQMIIMLMVVFVIISIIGRMSYQIKTWIQGWWARRKKCREKDSIAE